MGDQFTQQPQQAPQPAQPVGGAPTTAAVPNDAAAASAEADRRKKAYAQLSGNKSWLGALGGLAPPDAGTSDGKLNLKGGDATKLQHAAYKLSLSDTAGGKLALDYLTAAGADGSYTSAVRTATDNARTDVEGFKALDAAIAMITVGHQDIQAAGLQVLAKLAMLTEDGRDYLRAEQGAGHAKTLDAYIAQNFGGTDEASKASKEAYGALSSAIKAPVADGGKTPAAAMNPAPLTGPEEQQAKKLIADIQAVFAHQKPLAANADAKTVAAQKASQAQVKQLQALITAAPVRIKDWVYAWKDDKGKGVLELLGSYMSPSQVEEINAILDPVERLFKDLVDLRNGNRDPKAPKVTEYALMHDFLVAHSGDAATRKRVQNDARIMSTFLDTQPADKTKILIRLVITGREEPDAVDKVHDACDKGDSNAACAAIFELAAKQPADLQKLRTDLIFTHRLKDKCGTPVVYNGIKTTAYDLFLRMCGVDPNDTKEAGSVDKQSEVDPNKDSKPPTPEELGKLEDQLYKPFAKPIYDQLSSYWCRDSKVMEALRNFQQTAAKPEFVDILRRAKQAPGPKLAEHIQQLGVDVRLKCQRGLDADNLHEAERILGFVADQATTGVIGGQGTLATDTQVKGGQGKVSLEQALRETTLQNGAVLTQFIHDKATELAGEMTRWFGPRADHVRSIWSGYKSVVNEAVCADLREKTGQPRVWAIELLANAYLPIGGGALETKLKEGLGKEHNDVITEMGMSPTDIAARKSLADQKAVQDNHDESKNTAQLQNATDQAKQAAQVDSFRSPAKELFDGYATVGRLPGDDKLKDLGGKLASGLGMAKIAAAGPAPVPASETDVSAKPGGPVHPGEAAPTDFASFYKREYGIDPRRHAVEIAKQLASKERTAQQIGDMLGVHDASLYAPPVLSDDDVVVDEKNITLVSPGFSGGEAKARAKKIWDLFHGNGQVQLIRQQFGSTQEEDRLINIAFRKLSGGIDVQFYLQQHLSQQQWADKNGADSSYMLTVGGVTVVGSAAETEAAAERAATGKVSLDKQLLTLAKASNMDEVYSLIESATPDQKREILANSEVMTQLRAFGDDSYEWNRIYKGLTGQSDLFDRLESRAHGKHGFIGGTFEGTDEKGMGKDIAAYAKQRKVEIRAEVVATLFGGKEPQDPGNKKKLDSEVTRRLRVEFQSHMENPSIRALLTDELSGAELAKVEGQLGNSGEESKVASALTEGDWTEDEEKILDDIKKMTPAERKRCRENPEYISQLRKAIQTQATWRDAMMLLESNEDGSKGENEDNFSKLEKASRSFRQDSTELMFEQDDVIEALSKLTPDEYARLKANPRLQAQILTSLEGHPDMLAKARQMMAFNAADAGATTGLTIGDKPDPAKGIYPKAQVERLAFMKFSAENQVSVGASRGWGVLLQAAISVYNMKLKPSEALKEEGGGGGEEGGDKPLEAKDIKPENGPQPTGAPAATANAATPPAAAPAADKKPADPKTGEDAVEEKLRKDILADTQQAFRDATTKWGSQKADSADHQRTYIEPAAQQSIIEKAILHQADPSNALLMASTGFWGDDEDRIKETLRKASDDQVIKEWVTVVQHSPNGSASLKEKYEAWKAARPKEAAPDAKRKPKVGSPEWIARTAFKTHVIDTSEMFEDLLLKYTGGLFADDAKTGQGEKRVRDNSEWLEWRSIVRDRIPNLDRKKIGTAIGATGDAEATKALEDHTLSDTLGQLEYDQERYLVDRGEASNYNMDRVTAGGEGLALDNSMDAYRQTVMQSIISKGPEAGETYGDIDAAEQAKIADAKGRFQQNDGAFREAKSQVATIAATVVALIITAVVTVLTAGTATGPLATILIAAITAAAASAGSNATKKAVQGTDFEFGKEGLENIARDTIMGAVTAGTTWYAGKIVNGLFAASGAAEQAAVIARTAAEPGFFLQMGRQMAENSLQTGMQGAFESGMAAFDPAMWLDGWNEGWRRGSAKMRERASEIPMEMLRAAVIAAMSHTANAGIGKLKGGAGGEGEENPFAGKDPSKLTLAERSQLVGSTMWHGAKEGVVLGSSEILLDEKTYRSEGGKPADMLGHVANSSANMAQMSAGSAQAKEGHAAGQPGEGGEHEPGALVEMTAQEAATKKRIEAADRELAQNGTQLSEHEQKLYKEVCSKHGGGTGTDTTVMSVAEFKQARAEMVEKAAATYEAESNKPLTAEERAAFMKWVEAAPTLHDYIARAEAGPSGAPGGPPAPKKAPAFDKPAECAAERQRAQQLLEKLATASEATKTSTGAVAELRPQQVEAIAEAKKLMAEIAESAKTPADHAQIADLTARINNVSAELGRNLETASGGQSVDAVREALKSALEAADGSPADATKHKALHTLVVSGEVSQATTPGEAAAAAAAAPKKLAELKALLEEVKAARDNAVRRAASAPKDEVAAAKDEPKKDELAAKKDEPVKKDEPAKKDEQQAKADEPKKTEEPAKVEDPKKDTKTGGVDDVVMSPEAKAKSELGSQFAGNTLEANPVRAKAGIDAALATALPDGARLHGDVVEMPRGNEHVPLEVKVSVSSEAPAHEFAAAATLELRGPDHAVITVSPGAPKEVVERAVAGKLAELEALVRDRSAGKRADTTSALVEGSQAKELSPQDYNQIGQLKAALHQIEAAKASGDAAAAESLKRDAYALAVGMGLLEQAPDKPLHKAPGSDPRNDRVVGPEAATKRIELIDGVLGGDKAKLHSLLEGARADANTIGDIRAKRAEAREKLRAWCEQQIAARKEANAKLQGVVDAAIGADGTGHVFDRIIVGGGWAATADFATLGAKGGEGVPGTMSISHGGDPWAGRGDLLMGQNPAELEMRGMAVQPSDLAADPHDFASSKDFATAVGASGAMAGMPTYDGQVTKIEQRPEGDAHGWPDGANWRISANGKTFYTSKVDVVSGPGPARVPNAGKKIHDPSGFAIDSHGGKVYRYTPGGKTEFHEVSPTEVPPDVLRRLEAERGNVSKVYVDHESGITVDTSTKPETYRDKDGNQLHESAVPPEVARRLGTDPNSSKDDGPALVDQKGRLQSTRVFDPESNHQIDLTTHKVYGPDGHEVDAQALPADVKNRLGINSDGTFRDPRFTPAGNGYSVNPVTGHVIETATGKEVDISKLDDTTRKDLEEQIAKRRVGFGGERMGDEYKPGPDGKPPEVLIYGAGASGAWDVEQAAAGGAKIDWSGRLRLPKPDKFPEGSPERAKLEELHNPNTPPARKQELLRELEDVILTDSFSDGYNRRNTVPGVGAYSPEVLDKVEQNTRSIVDVQPTTDGRFYVRFSDGTSHVYDKVTMSIGQNAGGEGGVGDLLKGTALKPHTDAAGGYSGAESTDGSLRVLGAAGVTGPVLNQMPPEAQKEVREGAGNLPADSRNIPPAIRNQAGKIAAANEADIGGTKVLSPAERARLNELVKQHGLVEGPRLFDEERARDSGTETGAVEQGASKQVTGDKGEADFRAPENAPAISEKARAKFDGMSPEVRSAHEQLFAKAENNGQRVLLERGLAAGHTLLELEQLRYAMAGMTDAEALKQFSGSGLVQFYQQSCVPTSYQIAIAEVDPVYAFHLRNHPEEMMQAQQNALVIGGGAQTPRQDLHKPNEALKGHLDDPDMAKKLADQNSYDGKGSRGGIESTEMQDQLLHKQLEKATGVKYDVITNETLDFDREGHGEFAEGKIPHDRIGKAVDAGQPVIFGWLGHAQVIVGREVGADGTVTYIVSDPMEGKTSKWPAHYFDDIPPQSFTLPSEGKAGPGEEKIADDGKETKEPAKLDAPAKTTGTDTSTLTGGGNVPADVTVKLDAKAKSKVGELKGKYKDMPADLAARVVAKATAEGEAAYEAELASSGDKAKAANAAQKAVEKATRELVQKEAEAVAEAKGTAQAIDGTAYKDPTKLKGQMDDFNAGKLAPTARKLSPLLEGKTYAEMKALLDDEVKHTSGATATLKQLKDPTPGAGAGAKQDQWVYSFADGTEIRIKEKGDAYRLGATFAVEVKDTTAAPVAGDPQANILFKIDSSTRPVPKGAEDELQSPYSKADMSGVQYNAWMRAVADAGHRVAKK